MILAVLPLVPIAYAIGASAVAGIVGLVVSRNKGKGEELDKLQGEMDKVRKHDKELMTTIIQTMANQQQQHKDDLNGVIANEETGQTAEEEEFGINPTPSKALLKSYEKINAEEKKKFTKKRNVEKIIDSGY